MMTLARLRIPILLLTLANCCIRIVSAFTLENQLHQLSLYGSAQKRSSGSRDILQPRHQADFVGNNNIEHGDLFDAFARTVCLTSAVPRKELFEAWATALFVHDRFPTSTRVADLACGHGLLSRALLLMDQKQQRTAICIDKRMPGSAEKVGNAMLHEWPQLVSRWDFVEGKLDAIEPCSSTLLCGVHACGVLSDQIISFAIAGNAPLALVPCCHTRKSLDLEERLEFENSRNNIIKKVDEKTRTTDDLLSTFVDARRMERLRSAGFEVEREEIPKLFTPKNTLLLASPPSKRLAPEAMVLQEGSSSHPRHQNLAPPSLLSIPLGDDLVSMTIVKSLAGKVAAEQRKQPPPPSRCVSVFMPNETTITPNALLMSVLSMVTLYNSDDNEEAKPSLIKVEYADEESYLHPVTGMYARTFRIVYGNRSKEQATTVHDMLSECFIAVAFPGCIVRR